MRRLIDADMLKSAIARYSEKLLSHKNLSIVKNAIREVLGDINFAIDIQPTIDAVPVSTLEQIKWERDSFAEQIREIGGEPFAKWDAMDVVKVVRCKDCKYFNPHVMECEGIGKWFGLEGEWGANDYCSKAERKDDE